ncbi:amino acid ABC transporter permease [Atopobacter sp. AH10]|uniref:amino acid ABC transporter permease n=1 Tax=Atopobacter sp. AH10 TaxID=2315861 RepID=UPI000EF177DC|nr:amino acid ABC transporter permease [Atopobacter sp. AH10]RLK63924.1 amino acid ABC transporter permease [Atopobacter sp. AH10]
MDSLGLNVLFKGDNFYRLLLGLVEALKIAAISVLLSILFGIILGHFMNKRHKIIYAILRIYLEVVRIMPQLVLLFIVFFGSTRAFSLDISAEFASILVFTFWGTAEMSDLVRSAIQSIPVQQYESAEVLGLSPLQSYRYVILPQAIRRLLPLTINLVMRMIKTTSLVLMIGVIELLKVGQQIIEANRMSSPNAVFGVYLTIFILYFLACWPISLMARWFEKKWR